MPKRTPKVAAPNQAHPNKFKVTLNFSLSGVKAEIRQLHGRDHYVVPTVMMVEGVHNGSSGAGYYAADVMRKADIAWNSKPIVLGHPAAEDGTPLLAASADVLNAFQVGILCNTQTGEDCRQVSEAWLEKSLLESKAPELATAVAAGQVVEVSTGYYLEADMTQGIWNSENYTWKATSLQPDHFAILPKGVTGACSVNDGAGLCRNEEGDSADETTEGEDEVGEFSVPAGKSLGDVLEAISAEIYSKFPDDVNSGDFTYVVEVFPEHVIFRRSGELFSVAWAFDADGRVALTGPVTPVKKEVTYTPIRNSSMTKEQMVAAIIAANKGFTAAQQPELLSLSQESLIAIHNSATAKPPVANSLAELAAITSPALNATLNAAVALREQIRSAKITTILASGITANQAELEATSDAILDGMAALAAKATQPATQPAAVGNQSQAATQPATQPAAVGNQQFGFGFPVPFGAAPMAAFNAGAAPAAPTLPAGFAPSLPSYIQKK